MKHPSTVRASLDKLIAEHGWAVQGVFGSADSPSFSYTVGLTAKGLPEVIVFGLAPEDGAVFLNLLARRFTTDGVPALDTNLDEVAEGLPAQLVAAPRSETDKYMFATGARYPGYTALQLVWPDANAIFPWQDGFDPGLVRYQPILRQHLN